MTNPFNHGSPGFSPDASAFPGFMPRIRSRSSYASVASGSNPGLVSASSHPPLNRLSYLLNPAHDPPSELYSRSSSRNHSMDADRNDSSPDGRASSSGSQAPQLPPSSRAFEKFMNNGVVDSAWGNVYRNTGFFTPSYLEGSSYIEKLEEAHKAKQTQKESQQQVGGGLQSSSSTTSLANKTPASHLGITYDLIERAPTFDDDDTIAPLPTRWNKDDKVGSLEVLADGQEIKYSQNVKNPRVQDYETSGIRADHPMPVQAGIYYFEVSLLSRRREETTVCLGFQTKDVALNRPPGWEPNSWGYHGDDGEVYSGSNVGKRYKDGFGPGDVVGCGVNFRTGQAFFTKNGVWQGTAFRDVKGKLYPIIAVKNTTEHICVNFGQTPFVFAIRHMMKEEQMKVRGDVLKTSIGRLISPRMDETDLIQLLVLQFLQHDGYVETARAFAEELHTEKQALNIDPNVALPGTDIKDDADAHHRQGIRRAILEGDIDKALKYTNAYYPDVLLNNSHVYFKLRCRKFIEMVRKSAELNSGSGKKSNGHSYGVIPNEMDVDENGFSDQMEEDGLDSQVYQGNLLEETIQYGQTLQAEFKDDPSREVAKALTEVFALLAYPNPLQVKEVAPLLDRRGRVAVAEELNSAILSSLGKSSRSALENLYGQTDVLLDYLREDGGPGCFFTTQSIVDEIPKSQPF